MKEVYRSDNISIFRKDKIEVMIYGGGSDWIMQLTNVTNSNPPFRLWYGKRELAELAAKEWLKDSNSWEEVCFG